MMVGLAPDSLTYSSPDGLGLQSKMFRLIIAGSRYFHSYSLLCRVCDKMLSRKVADRETITVLSGHCHGADLLGEAYARERGFDLETYEAEWTRYGPAAGPKRNAAMAEKADALMCFWNGRSRGTRNMIEEAMRRGLKVRVCLYEEEGSPVKGGAAVHEALDGTGTKKP